MSASQGPMRVFVAIPVPSEAKSTLASAVGQLSVLAPTGVRWADPAGIHLMLKFLGNVESSRVPDVAAATARSAQETPPFQVRLSGLGVFPNERRPRVLWTGVDAGVEHLRKLRDRLEKEMADLGFPREGRPFSPHLTLGRVRDRASQEELKRIGAAMATVSPGPVAPWLVESAWLMQSHLAPDGATYSILATAPLGGGPDLPRTGVGECSQR